MGHLGRACLAFVIALVAGAVDRMSGQRVPAGVVVAMLTLIAGVGLVLADKDRRDAIAFTPMALVAGIYASITTAQENLNRPEIFDHIIFIALAATLSLIVSPLLVGVAGIPFDDAVLQRASKPFTVLASIILVVLVGLIAFASITAVRRPTCPSRAARPSVAGEKSLRSKRRFAATFTFAARHRSFGSPLASSAPSRRSPRWFGSAGDPTLRCWPRSSRASH